ncbi:predicted protein [Enterococcus faecium 1,231,501]|nr:predicted protein [Enterococcus faecium 1,231,501]
MNICKGVVTKIVSQPLMFETMVFLCQLRTTSHNIYKTGRAVFFNCFLSLGVKR